jgi:hypothetical protein
MVTWYAAGDRQRCGCFAAIRLLLTGLFARDLTFGLQSATVQHCMEVIVLVRNSATLGGPSLEKELGPKSRPPCIAARILPLTVPFGTNLGNEFESAVMFLTRT